MQLNSVDGNFNQARVWKLKNKLLPRPKDPPMAKKDKTGNLITSQEGIKNLYIEEYKSRLKNRDMKPELLELYWLKSELWLSRLENMKNVRTKQWNIK